MKREEQPRRHSKIKAKNFAFYEHFCPLHTTHTHTSHV